jgi:hypothetical protein
MAKRRPKTNRKGPKKKVKTRGGAKKRTASRKKPAARKSQRTKRVQGTAPKWVPFDWLEVEILVLIRKHRKDPKYVYGMTRDEMRALLLTNSGEQENTDQQEAAGISTANIQANINKLRNRRPAILDERTRPAMRGKRGSRPNAYSILPNNINTWDTTAEMLLRLHGKDSAEEDAIIAEMVGLNLPDPAKENQENLSGDSVRNQIKFCKGLHYIVELPDTGRIKTTDRVVAEHEYLKAIRPAISS